MKKVFLIILAILYSALRLYAQNPSTSDSLKDENPQNKNEIKYYENNDSTNTGSWYFQGQISDKMQEEINNHLEQLAESMKSFNKNLSFQFTIPEDFMQKFNESFSLTDTLLLNNENLNRSLKDMSFDFKLDEAYLNNLQNAMKDLFENEDLIEEWKNQHQDQKIELEKWLEQFDELKWIDEFNYQYQNYPNKSKSKLKAM